MRKPVSNSDTSVATTWMLSPVGSPKTTGTVITSSRWCSVVHASIGGGLTRCRTRCENAYMTITAALGTVAMLISSTVPRRMVCMLSAM